MKFGENSPQQDPLTKMADKRAEEYFKKERAEKLARVEEALSALRTKLGLKPRETLRDFLNLSPSPHKHRSVDATKSGDCISN